jgi:hypothetical protein
MTISEVNTNVLSKSDTLPVLAEKLVLETQKLVRNTQTEEDLRIGFEKILEPIRLELNLKSTPKYEKSVFSGRSDAVHGQLIIEYEPPGSFSSKRNLEHAYEQLVRYLSDEAQQTSITSFVGVGFDGEQIFFVQYREKNGKTIDRTKFSLRGPYEFNAESARTFLIHLRALSRLPLTAEHLAEKFGPQSTLAPKMVSALINALEYWGDKTHINTFYDEWKRLFGIVYGEQFASGFQKNEIEAFSKLYNVRKETDFQELLFSIHSYFAFLMKLITAELLTLRDSSFASSIASELAHISDTELRNLLEDIENGGIFARKGITNFLEGDFFRWYLDAFDSPELKEAVREVARALSEFEPATSTLEPASTRDLLKKLYQYLVPREVRHRLGEYYTPDWLAEFLLNEVGYDGNIGKRLLDPACGSGTFLVLAIQRAKDAGLQELPPVEVAKRIIKNIWGFDLNPMAVIAARTNYLFALGDFVNELPNIEIPIYLTDSVLTPTRTSGNLFGKYLEVSTSVGKFQVPAEWVREGGLLLARATPLIEEMVRNQYNVEEAVERFKTEGLVFPTNEQVVKDFYIRILELERQKKNSIWARFLKNVFAPVFAGQFDYVVGNPPWIRWGYLSQDYRAATFTLWVELGLFPKTQDFASRKLGGGEKDFSMLFTFASAKYYLKEKGTLGFLITQEVFKSKGAGEGFRRFQLGENSYLKVLKAHDLVSIQPFEGASNKTSLIVIRKGERTNYPVPYFLWTRRKGVGKIATDKSLEDVVSLLQCKKLLAKPIGKLSGSWQTISSENLALKVIEGSNYYKARRGASTEPYGVFWLEIKYLLSNGNIIISNLPEKGKLSIPRVEATIEPDLVYPAIRGGDIKRWGYRSKFFVLIPYPLFSKAPYTEQDLKRLYPRTFSYLLKFRNYLMDRAAYKKLYQSSGKPFHSQFNIQDYTFARFKVLWKRMASDIVAAVVSQIKTPIGYKTVIGTDTTSLFASDNESEAHYLCAIINSKPVRDFVKSFSSAGRGFGTPSVMDHVGIPKFEPDNPLHQRLSEISKKCHQLKAEGKEKEIEFLEKENDELVEQLFGLTSSVES